GGEFVDADADPVLVDGRLFVASYSDGVFALDPKDGQTIWTRTAPAVTSLAGHDDLILAASADGYVWGLSQREGQLVYRTRLPPGPMSRLVVDQNMVVLTAGDAGLIVLDARTGKPLQAMSFGSALNGDPMWDGDDLALLSSTGYLYKLSRGSRGLVE
ncbi:MAG: PQQ-binding-like beta-propeller repeat protein, partial [Myxococcota bacterium]